MRWKPPARSADAYPIPFEMPKDGASALSSAEALHARLRRQVRREQAIAEAMFTLSSAEDQATMLKRVAGLAQRVTQARYAMLAWMEAGELRFVSLGMSQRTIDAIGRPPEGKGLLGLIWREGRVVRIDEIGAHEAFSGFPEHHPPMRCLLGAPIEFAGQIMGALYLCDKRGGGCFDGDDEGLVRILAAACAMALSNLQKLERLRQASEERVRHMQEHAREIERANRLLRNREIELELMNEALRQANEAKSQFLANTSHELRTPLNAIIGFSDLLLSPRASIDERRQRTYLEHINQAGKQLLELINGLLDLSKIESGMMEIHEEACSVGMVLDEVLTQLKPMAERKAQRIAVRRPDDDHALYLDAVKLRQVWMQLIGNAIKFTPEGGEIVAGYGLLERNGETVLEGYVRDNGIGIAKEDLERIFEPFVQVDGGLARSYGGTGLGLALVRRMLEIQGGDIEVESVPGEGSRFTFSLPARPVRALDVAAQAPAVADEADAGVQVVEEAADASDVLPHILIVDDDHARAARVVEILERESYTASICALDEVERMAAERAPFLIMVGLPKDPADVYRRMSRLRNSKATRGASLVLLGGDAQAPRFSLGTVDTVDKRLTRTELVDMIARHDRFGARPRVMTILVIDDDACVREYIKEALHGQGYRILLAARGKDGLRAAIEHEPDLIILDLMMPDMSGFDVVDALKRHPTARDIPVIVFTAKDLTRAEVMRLGREVEQVLSKGTTSREELLRELRTLEMMYPAQARLMDSVLRCYNPRYLRRRLKQECSRTERYGQQFALVGWRLDGYEAYMRRHGMRWAVAALKDMVEIVYAIIRKGDVLVRSEEAGFVLVLPGISLEEARRVAEKVRLRIRLHRFPLAGQAKGCLTASFGCVHVREGEVDSEAMLARLQQRVQRAVAAGGDCCVSEDQS